MATITSTYQVLKQGTVTPAVSHPHPPQKSHNFKRDNLVRLERLVLILSQYYSYSSMVIQIVFFSLNLTQVEHAVKFCIINYRQNCL